MSPRMAEVYDAVRELFALNGGHGRGAKPRYGNGWEMTLERWDGRVAVEVWHLKRGQRYAFVVLDGADVDDVIARAVAA